MGFLDRIGRAASTAVEGIGGFLGDVVSGAVQSFSEGGFQGITGRGGVGGTIGSLLGDLGEGARTIFLPTRTPLPSGGAGPGRGGVVIPSTVPTGPGGIWSPPGTPGGIDPEILRWGGLPAPTPPPMMEASMLPVALPVGAAIARAVPRILGTAAGVGGLSELMEWLPGGGGETAVAPTRSSWFLPRPAGVSVNPLVVQIHPLTGKEYYFKHVGRPVLFSGDFSACRRVAKIASKARRRSGGR